MIKIKGNNITAITACGQDIIKVVACGETVFEKTQPTPVLNMNWVDLGLPSGTLWADRNVGATATTDVGYYFQWGGKNGYRATSNCTLCTSAYRANVPYNINASSANVTYSKYNETDGLYIIEPSDDPCHEYFHDVCANEDIPYGDGKGHSMTLDEYTELYQNTTASTIVVDGVTVLRFTGQNGNYIDFPYCGYVNLNRYSGTRNITSCTSEVDTRMGQLNSAGTASSDAYTQSYIIDSTAGGDLMAGMKRYNLCPVRGCCSPDAPSVMPYRYKIDGIEVDCQQEDYDTHTINYMSRVDMMYRGFEPQDMEELYIGDCTYGLESAIFSDCYNLKKAVMSNSVTTLNGGGTFADCPMLSSVTISSGLTSIDSTMFWGCDSLTSITIPSSIISIGRDAFTDTGLIDVDIPSSVQYIEGHAFDNCYSLNSVTMHTSTPPTAGDGEIFGNEFQNLTIYVPQGSISTYENTTHWDLYTGHYVEY